MKTVRVCSPYFLVYDGMSFEIMTLGEGFTANFAFEVPTALVDGLQVVSLIMPE